MPSACRTAFHDATSRHDAVTSRPAPSDRRVEVVALFLEGQATWSAVKNTPKNHGTMVTESTSSKGRVSGLVIAKQLNYGKSKALRQNMIEYD